MAAPAYVHGTGTTPLLGQTIGDMWDAVVAEHGGREALVSCHQDIRWTYSQLAEEVDRCARALLARGVAKGDRVGMWSPNCAEWVVVQLATAKIGAILVNVNPSYRAHELEYALTQSGCSHLILAPGFKGADYPALLAETTTPALRQSVLLGEEWTSLLEAAERVTDDDLARTGGQLSFDDPINIQYTSGTTGFPKGATLSHHNILNNGYFVGEVLGYTEADRICVPVPFYHCFGMVMGNLAGLSRGACIVIPEEGFEPEATLEAVEAERCTSLYGVPTMFIAELGLPDFERFDLASLRTGIMAGAPCPVEVMKRVRSDMHMEEVTICYGMTETSPVSTQTVRDAPLQKRVATVGTVHPHVEIKIVDPETDLTVERGQTGELCTRGYSVMLGYWDDEEATARSIDVAGWMHTGDLAEMDDDGYVAIVGRNKDMIIRGGENIYPREVEEFLYTHPDIVDVQVVGVPDERLGEEVCAWVILRPGAELDAEQLREFCRDKITRYKIPRYVRSVGEFPMTVTGKIQKFKIREHEIEERGLVAASQPSGA
ncbi:MAG: fatty-acyl-CoA synthase [Thermoleophilaceae bacterium]|nr:fatty-acyl-CoA synthase [Thermoleophilaceae bacterium]